MRRIPQECRIRVKPNAEGSRRAAGGPPETAAIDESALTAAKIRDMPISAALRRVLLIAACAFRRADRVFAWMARGAVAVIQLCRRLPVSGVPDAETWAILIRSALLFRVAGWLIAALGVVGLAKSAGGSGADSVLDALDRFRATLGGSTDPGLNSAFASSPN
jgi:hypothetical protein